MPYKKESPFASFRDPKRPVRNYNPTNFQMPDINSIFNKTADGDKVEEPQKAKDNNVKDKVAGPVLDKIDNPEPAPITKKSLRQDRKAGEKEFNKELRRIKQLSKASTKDITADQRKKFIEAKDKIQAEKDFRKEAKKEGFNPADYKNKLLQDEMRATAKKLDDEGKLGKFSGKAQIASRENIPMDRIKSNDIGASFPGLNSPGRAPFNDPSVLRTGEPPMSESEKRKMQMIKNPLGRGLQMNKDMKQVNSKGSGFPMLQPNQNMVEQEQIKNRAGRPQDSNILTNDPNINQPMNKVAASNFQRNTKFNDIASGQGVYNPPQSTMPMPNQPANNQTPQQQTFPQQGSFAMYDGPEFNEGLRKASAEGKLDNNPKFKAAVDSAPGMYGEGPSMRSAFKAFENDHLKTKVTKSNLRATERDDAAHMDYLKRDIKYDNAHGGSKKQMLDDEKHISKLAGDLKYDKEKQRPSMFRVDKGVKRDPSAKPTRSLKATKGNKTKELKTYARVKPLDSGVKPTQERYDQGYRQKSSALKNTVELHTTKTKKDGSTKTKVKRRAGGTRGSQRLHKKFAKFRTK